MEVNHPYGPAPLSKDVPTGNYVCVSVIFARPRRSTIVPFMDKGIHPIMLYMGLPCRSFVGDVARLSDSKGRPMELLRVPPTQVGLIVRARILVVRIGERKSSIGDLYTPSAGASGKDIRSSFVSLTMVFYFR